VTASVGTVVIGAGQAGLAMSRCLSDRGLPHVVLERGAVANSWATQRWESFRLLSPNWQTRLPGHSYAGRDPDGFMTGAEVVDLLRGYARSFDAPVHTGVEVLRVRPGRHRSGTAGWWVETDAGVLDADDVVVATGDLARPRVPAISAAVPPGVRQLHAGDYRRPDRLPAGAVLVVGAGPSGQQIARELAAAGRRVHLAVGRHKSLPRCYRGRDAYWWMDRTGMLARTVDSLPGGKPGRTPNAVLAGGTRDLDVPALVAEGVTAHGRLRGVRGGVAEFADDLAATVEQARGNADRFRTAVDAFAAAHGLDVPEEPAPDDAPVPPGPCRLDLAEAGVTAVVWATGFSRDLSFVDAPILDPAGDPRHRRGVTDAPGLYLLGLRWQHRRSSSFLDGVGADAQFLAERIAARETAVAA
jgi:putative flavoprotein involved in K+ transport